MDSTGRIYVLVRGLAEYRLLYEKQKNPDPRLDPAAMILDLSTATRCRGSSASFPTANSSADLTFDLRELARTTHDYADSLNAWKQI